MNQQQSIDRSSMTKLTSQIYYDRTQRLGKGNYGQVYKGYNIKKNQIIAVKHIPTRNLIRNLDYERQIIIMHELAKINHPNIMGYYGYHDDQTGVYFFLELCTNGNLKQLITLKISELRVLSLYGQLLSAMVYINQKKIIHRDLKPDNILLDDNMQLKIADFGLARDIQTKMTKGICTPFYAAPEILALKQQYNQKCDVWSAGLILYEMLVGKQLYEKIKINKFANTNYRPDIPAWLHPQWTNLLMKMFIYNPKNRPTFTQLSKYFIKIQPNMRKELQIKYGQQKISQLSDSSLMLTTSISPYRSNISNPNMMTIFDMLQRLKQQRSFLNINNLRKWLIFIRVKTQFMIKPIKLFNKCQYTCIKNVHKYLIMFLSTCTYIARLQSYILQLKNKQINLPQGKLTQSDIISTHYPQFNKLIETNYIEFQHQIQKFKQILQKQIVNKILQNYMQKQQDIIKSYDSVRQLIYNSTKNIYASDQIYLIILKDIINSNGVFFQGNIVREFNVMFIQVYLYLRMLANIDSVFLNTQYTNQDYFARKIQQVQNGSKQELMGLVQKINYKGL